MKEESSKITQDKGQKKKKILEKLLKDKEKVKRKKDRKEEDLRKII